MKNTSWKNLANAKYIQRLIDASASYNYLWPNAVYANIGEEYGNIRRDIIDIDDTKYANFITLDSGIWNHYISSAFVALIAYDSCGYLLDSDPSEVEILAKLGNSAAILLLPACYFFNQIKY